MENEDKFLRLMSVKRMRYYICENSIYFFGLYYLSHYFSFKSPPFHVEMANDLHFKNHKFLMWIMFRESAKTVWAKIKVLHAICYGKKKNIAWVSEDERKATKQIMSIASELKSNKKIINDFGQLFYEDETEKRKKTKVKRLKEFITLNNVAVRATSTKISSRGELQDQFRPDLYIIDDIENMKTARSITITKGVIEYFEELVGGRSVDCDILILSNRIARNGSIAQIEKMLLKNPNAIIHEVKIMTEKGVLNWPGRFVKTIKEAEKINKLINEPRKHVKSIEQLKIDLGTHAFNREMMLEPLDSVGAPVKMEWIRRGKVPELSQMDIAIAVDPAISQKQNADYFSITATGRHKETGKLYVLRAYKTRCRISEQVNLITNWFKLFPGAVFRIETVAYQEALVQLLYEEQKKGIYIPIREFKPREDKFLRVSAIAPYIERGDVIFSDEPNLDDTIDSLCSFPFIDNDDDVDSFTSSIEFFVHKINNPGLLVS